MSLSAHVRDHFSSRPSSAGRSGTTTARWSVLVVVTGLGSLAFGYPFLTTHTAHVTLPWLGELHLPSAALFDAGVFAVVVGSTLLMLTALAHQSLRARRRERR